MAQSSEHALQTLDAKAGIVVDFYKQFQEQSDVIIQEAIDAFCKTLSDLHNVSSEVLEILSPFFKGHIQELLNGSFTEAFDRRIDENILIMQQSGVPYFVYVDLQNQIVDQLLLNWREHLALEQAYQLAQALRYIFSIDLTIILGRLTEVQQASIKEEKHLLSNLMGKKIIVHLDGIIESLGDLSKTTDDVVSKGKSTLYLSSSFDRISGEFKGNLKSILENSKSLNGSSSKIVEKLNAGTESTNQSTQEMNETNESILTLSEAAGKIGEVVKIINEIANQTNLLALNATIEAARAGNAGKGFSVVASEVKNLAGQTASATEEITLQINAMQDATSKVIESMEGITKTVNRINDTTVNVRESIEDHNRIANDIFENINDVKDISENITSMLQQVETMSNETDECATTISAQNSAVVDHCLYFKGVLEKFVSYSDQKTS